MLWTWLFGARKYGGWSRLALDIVHPRITNRYPTGADQLAQTKGEIATIRAEYRKVKPWPLRRQIMGWCDWYERAVWAEEERLAREAYAERLNSTRTDHA